MVMNVSEKRDPYLKALACGWIMTLTLFCPLRAWGPLPAWFAVLVIDSVGFYAAISMVRYTWKSVFRLVPILWLMAYSLFGIFIGLVEGYANLGPMSERRIATEQAMMVDQYFKLFGGAALFLSAAILCFRGFFGSKSSTA